MHHVSRMLSSSSKGIMIITTDVETNKKFDGLAGKIDNTPVVISTSQSGDR